MATRRKRRSKGRRDQLILATCYFGALSAVTLVMLFGKGFRDREYWLKMIVIAISWGIGIFGFIWRSLGEVQVGGRFGERLFVVTLAVLIVLFLLIALLAAIVQGSFSGIVAVGVMIFGVFGIGRHFLETASRRSRSRDKE